MICDAPARCMLHVIHAFPASAYASIEGIFFFAEPQISPAWTVVIRRRYRGPKVTQLSRYRTSFSTPISSIGSVGSGQASRGQARADFAGSDAVLGSQFSAVGAECPGSSCRGDATPSSGERPDESRRGAQPLRARASPSELSLLLSQRPVLAMLPGALRSCIRSPRNSPSSTSRGSTASFTVCAPASGAGR
jgi:hypothetical protein